MTVYTIRTNLPPEAVNQIGLEIYAMWRDFALGKRALGGKRLIYPTGRYAAAIEFKQTGTSSVAITADEDAAPEAAILETGHRAVDLKTIAALQDRTFPMHREIAPGATRRKTKLRREGGGPPGLSGAVWEEVRSSEFSGYASIGPNSAPGSWISPAMAAYAPAFVLSEMARKMADKMAGRAT